MLEKEYEVLVAGGGISGVCAAIASARAGARTALIQNRSVLGGNSSSEIRVWTRGATGGGNLYAEEMGILGELKLHNLHINPKANPVLWDEALLDIVLAEPELDLYLNTHIYHVETETIEGEQRIKSVHANGLASEIQYCFTSEMYIDATGDGTVGAMAKASYRKGRESRSEYGENLAVENEDNDVLGSSIFFQTKEEPLRIPFIKPNYAYDIEYVEELLKKGGGRIVNETMNGCDYWWLEYGGIKDTIKDSPDINLELKKLVMGVWNYIKNSGKFNSDNLTLEWIGNLSGKRESRRFEGEYTLNQNDLEENSKFPDAVCYGGWYMDFHPSGGIYSEEEFCTQIPVFPYDIPLRCFYNKVVSNLLFAGRNISVTHVAFASTRIMDTCGLIGQVAGETAAHCIKEHISLNQLEEKEQFKSIQQKLLKNDLSAFGITNQDSNDLAQKAKISSSGSRIIGTEPIDGYMDIKNQTFLVAPAPMEKLDCHGTLNCQELSTSISLTIKIKALQDTTINYSIYESELPSRLRNGVLADSGNIQLKEGEKELIIPITDKITNYMKISFEENPYIKIAYTNTSITGFLIGYEHSAQYKTPCVKDYRISYDEQQLINGCNRIYKQTNLWISKELSSIPKLRFEWDAPEAINQLRISLNPGLHLELPSSITISDNPHHGFAKRIGAAPEMVKSFEVYGRISGEKTLLASITDNYQRLCIVDFDEVLTDQIELVIKETYGSDYAEIFEVRIYGKKEERT